MGFNVSKTILLIIGILGLFASSLEAANQRALTDGWNLVSVPVNQATNVPTYLSSALASGDVGRVTKIWTYNGGWKQWNSTITVESESEFVNFSPNQGYWFLMGGSDTLNLDAVPFATRALQINATGWALASFNQDTVLDMSNSVLNSDTVDSSHVAENIKKIWGYDGNWKSYTSSDQSGSLTSIVPGYAYWFLAQDVGDKIIDADNILTITPAGTSAEDAVLIIGGATTLFPPDEATAEAIGGSMGKVRLARYSTSRLATVGAASSNDSASMHCTGQETVPVELGMAEMYSVDGQLLAEDPILCGVGYNSDPANTPLTFEIRLTKEEAQVIKDKPTLAQDAIVNIRLHSGQNQKTCLPKNPADDLKDWEPTDPVGEPIEGERANTSSTSTLAAALVAQEIGKRLGFPPDKFKLGEKNGGLEELNSEINSIVSSTAAEGVDILGNMQNIMSGADDPNSALYAAKRRIDSVNAPGSLTDASRVGYRGDEISNIMAGNSTADSGDTSFTAQLEQARNIGSGVNELLVKMRNAVRKGVISSDEESNLGEFINKMTKSAVGKSNVLDAGNVLVNSLGMANATSGDAALGNLVKEKAKALISDAHAAMDALDTTTGTTQAMNLAAQAVEFPEEMVGLMAKNKEAAKKLAGVLGMGAKLLDRAESEDNSAESTGDRKLDNLGNLTSKLANSQGLLTVLAKNADSSDDVSEIFGAAVGAVADADGAAEDIIKKIGEAKTAVETSSDIRVDFSDMMKKSKRTVKKAANLAKILAKNAGDASTAQKILAEVASAVTTEELNEVLQDDTLSKEFSLGSKIFADAGPIKKIRYSTASTPIKLDARNSFNPSGSALMFKWYALDANGNETTLSTTASAENSLIETSVATTGGLIEKDFRVVVSDATGRSAQADTKIILIDEVPPVILAPRYLVAREGEPIKINASESFDPDGFRELRFDWSFPGAQVDANGPIVSVSYSDPGKYTGTLTLSTLNVNQNVVASAVQVIGIKVNGVQPPIADAGYDLVLSVREATNLVNEFGGLRMDNYSFSLETGGSDGLTYEWEPASYFSRVQGENSTSVNPLFNVVKPGKYDVTLTVTDTNANNQSASDDVTIVVKKGRPPFADAGGVTVVRLGATAETIRLDGRNSFSFVTPSPAYEWSGPTSFSGSSATSAVAEIVLDPNNFTSKQRLSYTLKVTDENGSAEDTATVVVLPSVAPPVAVVELFPRLPFYRSGDTVHLDASFSFHPDNLELSYDWKVLGNAEVMGLQNQPELSLVMPEVSADTKIKVQLVLTDTRGKTATHDEIILVRAEQRPPVAIVEPQFIVLQASNNPRPIAVSGLESFARSQNELDFSWRIDRQQISLVNSDLSSSVIYVQAVTDVPDTLSEMILTVTDRGTGLTDSVSVLAKLRRKKEDSKPIFLDGQIEQEFDFTTRRFKPVLTPGDFFANGETYAYDSPAVYVYEKGDVVSLNGFGYDPNLDAASDTFNVTAAICEWSPVDETYDYANCSKNEIATSSGGFVDFSYASAPLTTASTWFVLDVRAGSGSKLKVVTMPFQVRPEQVAKQPVAHAVIKTIDSPSVGITEVGTTSFSGSFPDDGIFVVVSGEDSENPNGGGLKYQWDAAFVQTAAEKKSNPAPQLFLLGKDREELAFFWPLTTQALELKVSLKVFDEFSDTPSKTKYVTIKANKANRVPPVADPGVYPKVVFEQGDTVDVKLAGFGSYSPVGNRIGFQWTYLGFQTGVFDQLSATTATGVAAVATLEPGKHPFTLTVTDLTDTSLTDSALFVVEVEKKRVIDVDQINFGIDAFVDAYPIDAEVGQPVEIHSEAYVFPTRPDLAFDSIDFNLVKESFKITKKSGEEHTALTTNVAGTGLPSVMFSSEGEYIVEYAAWYDQNPNNGHDTLDQSEEFRRRLVIKVRDRIEPIFAHVRMDKSKFRQSQSQAAVIPVTLVIDNPNSGTWDYGYRFELFRADRPAGALQYDLSIDDGASLTTSGPQLLTSPLAELPLDLTGLPSGEFFLQLEVKAKKVGSDAHMRANAESFFRIVNSDVKVYVELFDPSESLDFSTIAVNVYGVTSTTDSLDQQLIYAPNVADANEFRFVEDRVRGFEFVLNKPWSFTAGPLAGQQHPITGLLFKVIDTEARNKDQEVRISEFRSDVPQDGDWDIDLIKRDDNVQIDGTFMSPGEYFSFQKDEVVIDFENADGVERNDLDLVIDEDELFVFTEPTAGVISTTLVTRPVFFANDGRRIVDVQPFSPDGSAVTPEEFFDRTLSQAANIRFNVDVFENAFAGVIYPQKGQLFMVEYPKQDGSMDYALMLITYQDNFGFAFRYAKATQTIPEISFGGSNVKDQIQLSLDFATGEFRAEGGVPNTEFWLVTSSNKGYVVSGTGVVSPSASCAVSNRLSTPYSIDEACVGTFGRDGTLTGYLDFQEEFYPQPGDFIEILGYSYEDPLGGERAVRLPNPLKYIFNEDVFGGFGLGYTKVVTDGQVDLHYFGEPEPSAVTDPANYMVKTSDVFDGWLFKNMQTGDNVFSHITDTSNVDGDGGVLSFYLIDPSNLDSTGKYLALSGSDNLVSNDGVTVERRKHVITRDVVWGNLVNAPTSTASEGPRWLEVRQDDYGFRSNPYLKVSTTTADGTVFIEGNPYGNFEDYREFIAVNYDTGLEFKGMGSYESYNGQRNFWELPQTDDIDFFTNTAPRETVTWVDQNAAVGSISTGTYRAGNSYNVGSATGEFGNDFRPRVTYDSTVLRVLPWVSLGDDEIRFEKKLVEVRVVERWEFPTFDENGQTNGFDDKNYEERVRRFWFADGVGFVRTIREHKYVSEFDQGYGEQGYRDRAQVVAYKLTDGERFVFDGDVDVLDPGGSKFTNVKIIAELVNGEDDKVYKLVVMKPSSTSVTGYETDTDVATQLATAANFSNLLPGFSQASFDVTNIVTEAPYILKAYAADYSVGDSSAVTETDEYLVAEIPFKLEGKREFVDLKVELRAQGESPAVMVFGHNGFSFLAGQFTDEFDSKRDFAYAPKPFGNGFELALNPYLPDVNDSFDIHPMPHDTDNMTATGITMPRPADRYIKEVFVEGKDLRERMEKVVRGEAQVSTAGLMNGQTFMELQPGKLYLYTGPGVESMKDQGNDRVLVLLGVTNRDEESVGFVYLLKAISELPQFASFEGTSLNNNFGYQIRENQFAESVRIQTYFDVEPGEGVYGLSFDAPAPVDYVQQAQAEGKLDVHVNLTIDAKGVYSMEAVSGVTSIVDLDREIDIFSLPSALPLRILTNSTTVTSNTTFDRPSTFLMTDVHGNHILMRNGSFFDYEMEMERYFIDAIYLMDGSQAVSRKLIYPDENQEMLVEEESLNTHNLPLDFAITGKPFFEITDANDALLEIEGDRFAGNFRVFAKESAQADQLRGALVTAKFEFDDEVSAIEIDRFDGRGHVEVSKAQATQGVELGELDFGGFLDGNIRFKFNDDPSRHSGDKVRIKKLLWQLPGSTTVLSKDASVTFEFSDQPVGIQPIPQPGEGFQLIGARIGLDETSGSADPYVDMWFTRDVSDESAEFPYLVRLESFDQHMYDSAGTNTTDATEQFFFSPIELVIEGRKLRAYFPSNAAAKIATEDARFNLFVDADYSSSVPRGIKSTNGELLNYGYVNIGNKKLFATGGFFPFDSSNEFVYERFGDNQSADQNPIVSASMGSNGMTSYVSSADGSLVRYFKSGSFMYCGDESTDGSECVTLWNMNSTIGSPLFQGNGIYSVIRDRFDHFYAGGMEFNNAVSIDVTIRQTEVVKKHHFVFVHGVGLAQHFVDTIERGTFNYLNYKGIELKGYNIDGKARGFLQGLSGFEFQGIDIDFDLAVGPNLVGPFKVEFKQKVSSTLIKTLAYSRNSFDSNQQMTPTTMPLDVQPGMGAVALRFEGTSPDNPNPEGIDASSGEFELLAVLTDSNNTREVRTIRLQDFQTHFYWFADFGAAANFGGLRLKDGELYSLLKNSIEEKASDGTWDIKVEQGQNGLQLKVQGQSSQRNRLIRMVDQEGSFEDALSRSGHFVTTNGFTGQSGINGLNQEALEVEPGTMYLVKIPKADRLSVLTSANSTDIYALILVKDVNSFDKVVEFDYVLSDEVHPMGINFNFKPVNSSDPANTVGDNNGDTGDFTEKVPSRGSYLQLKEGDCADLELDPFDRATGTFDQFRVVNSCGKDRSTADISVVRLAVVAGEVNSQDTNRMRGSLETVIEIPGGYKPSGLKPYELYQLPHAMHSTALPDQSSETMIRLTQPLEIEFNQGQCFVYMPWEQRAYVGREDLPAGNDFIIQLSPFVPTYYDTVATNQPNSVQECATDLEGRIDFEYRYWDAVSSDDDLNDIAFRGDFNGTGKPHPLDALDVNTFVDLENITDTGMPDGPSNVDAIPFTVIPEIDRLLSPNNTTDSQPYVAFIYSFDNGKMDKVKLSLFAGGMAEVWNEIHMMGSEGNWTITTEGKIHLEMYDHGEREIVDATLLNNDIQGQPYVSLMDEDEESRGYWFTSPELRDQYLRDNYDEAKIQANAWKEALNNISANMVRVKTDPYGPDRFQIAASSALEGFGTAVSFRALGVNTSVPFRVMFEAYNYFGYRQAEFTKEVGRFRTGTLVEGHEDAEYSINTSADDFDPNLTGIDCSHPDMMNAPECESDFNSPSGDYYQDDKEQELSIDFGVVSYGPMPFRTMEITQLHLSVPFADLSTTVDLINIAVEMEGGHDDYGPGDGGHDEILLDFDPDTESMDFTIEQTTGKWYNTSPGSNDGSTIEFNGNTFISTYIDDGVNQEETGTFNMVHGAIEADTDEGIMNIYRATLDSNLTGSVFSKFTSPVVLVMLNDRDNPGKYTPELWFRNLGDLESMTEADYESLLASFMSTGNGPADPTDPTTNPTDPATGPYFVIDVSADSDGFLLSGDPLQGQLSDDQPIELYAGATYEFKVVTEDITFALSTFFDGVRTDSGVVENGNAKATINQSVIWEIPVTFDGVADFYDPNDSTSSRNGTFKVTEPPTDMGNGSEPGDGNTHPGDGHDGFDFSKITSFPSMGDSSVFQTLSGPSLQDCDGELFVSASSFNHTPVDASACPNPDHPFYTEKTQIVDPNGSDAVSYFELDYGSNRIERLFKSDLEVYNSSEQLVPATVVFYEAMINDKAEFRPEIWFEHQSDRLDFIDHGLWDRLFGGQSGDSTSTCTATSLGNIAICVSVDSDDRTTDTTDYGYVFNSQALELDYVASPGKKRDGVDYPEAFKLYRGTTYEFHINATDAPFTLVNFQTRIALNSSDGVMDNTTDNGVITFSIPSDTSLTGIVYRHQDPDNTGESRRGEEGHILIVDYDGNDDGGHFGPGDGQPAPIVFDLTHNGTQDYIFTNEEFPNGVSDPGSDQTTPIVLYRGGTYEFHNKTGGHPFALAFNRTDSSTHLTENDGVQGNGASGPSGIVTFTIPMDAQYDRVDYYCTAHAVTMFGMFNIMDYPGDSSDQGGNSTDSMFTGVSAFFDQDDNLTVEFDNLPMDVATVNVLVSSTQGFDPTDMSDVEILGGGHNDGDLAPETLSTSKSFVADMLMILNPQSGETLYYRLGAKDSDGNHLGMLSDEYEVTF